MFEARFSDGLRLYSEQSYTQTAKIIKWHLQQMEDFGDAVLYTGNGQAVAYFRNFEYKESKNTGRWSVLERSKE